MSNCGLLSGPSTSALIQDQLAKTGAKGDQAFTLALEAINALTMAFQGGVVNDAAKWTPNPQYKIPIDKSRVFAKPTPTPVEPGADFTMPPNPKNVLGDLEDIDDTLNDILTQLNTLIATMPQFAGVSVQDLYLSILASQYATMTAQMDAILAACPATSVLCATLYGWMQDGSVGMPVAVEQAMRDRAFGAEDRKAFQAQSEAMGDWLARGFSLPGGALDVKLQLVAQQSNDQKVSLNRDIYIESAKWEREVRQFAVEKTLQYEGIKRDFFVKVYDLARTVAGEWQTNHIKVQLAQVEVYKAEVEAFAAAANALQAMGATAATLIKAKIDEQDGYLNLFKAKLQAEQTRLDADVKIFGASLDLYKTEGDMENSRLNVLFKQDGLDLERMKIDGDMDMKGQELEVQKLLEIGKLTVQSYSQIAQTAGTLAAGWTSALHMSAGMEVKSSYDNNSSCSETHSYQY